MQQPVWLSRELCWMKKSWSPKGYILFHSTFLKWQNYSNEEQISVCPGFRRGRDGKEMGMAIIEHEGSFLWRKCSVFWPCRCQYLGCTIVFQDVTIKKKNNKGYTKSTILPVNYLKIKSLIKVVFRNIHYDSSFPSYRYMPFLHEEVEPIPSLSLNLR